MFAEHDCVVLTEELPGEGLVPGDVGVIVHVHESGRAFEVEFATLGGKTVAVLSLKAEQMRLVGESDMTHVRALEHTS